MDQVIAPLLDVDAAIVHVATVLIEQGYMVEDAYQAAHRIVYKCVIACAIAPAITPGPIEEN